MDKATAATEQMHRAGESSAYFARIQLSNGSDRACIATASRADYASVRWSKGSNRACIAVVYWKPQTARAAQIMHRYGGATAATEHASRRREQRRLCITTADALRRRKQGRLCIARAKRWQRQLMHRDGESRADYARVQRRTARDRHAKRAIPSVHWRAQ